MGQVADIAGAGSECEAVPVMRLGGNGAWMVFRCFGGGVSITVSSRVIDSTTGAVSALLRRARRVAGESGASSYVEQRSTTGFCTSIKTQSSLSASQTANAAASGGEGFSSYGSVAFESSLNTST